MSVKKMAALTASIVGAIGVAGSAGAWIHAELFVPSIVKECSEESDARLREVLLEHQKRPHLGSVTDHELELVISAIDRVERNLSARMSTLETAVLSK